MSEKKILKHLKEFIFLIIATFLSALPVDKYKIFISNFGGRGYGDNPKYLVEMLISFNEDFDFFWIVDDKRERLPDYVRPVKKRSFSLLYHMVTAGVWIDNIRNTWRPKKRPGQIYLQTWHGGYGLKQVEGQAEHLLHPDYVVAAKHDGQQIDGILAADTFQAEQMKRYFWLGEQAEILPFGLPRNDVLFDTKQVVKVSDKVRKQLGLSSDDFVILYMPTFRDSGDVSVYQLDFEGIRHQFEKKYQRSCVILVKYHPNVLELYQKKFEHPQIINVSCYADSQELYIAADVLISDYSSTTFDFMLLKKPVFLCALDVEDYCRTRGLVETVDKLPFRLNQSSLELLEDIEQYDEQDYQKRLNQFYDYYQSFDRGDSAKRTVEWLLSKQKELGH